MNKNVEPQFFSLKLVISSRKVYSFRPTAAVLYQPSRIRLQFTHKYLLDASYVQDLGKMTLFCHKVIPWHFNTINGRIFMEIISMIITNTYF